MVMFYRLILRLTDKDVGCIISSSLDLHDGQIAHKSLGYYG